MPENNQYLKQFHLPLKAEGRNYLDHDSFLDCSNLYEYEYNKLLEKCIEDIQTYLDILNEKDMVKILNLTATAKTISRKLKNRYDLLK